MFQSGGFLQWAHVKCVSHPVDGLRGLVSFLVRPRRGVEHLHLAVPSVAPKAEDEVDGAP